MWNWTLWSWRYFISLQGAGEWYRGMCWTLVPWKPRLWFPGVMRLPSAAQSILSIDMTENAPVPTFFCMLSVLHLDTTVVLSHSDVSWLEHMPSWDSIYKRSVLWPLMQFVFAFWPMEWVMTRWIWCMCNCCQNEQTSWGPSFRRSLIDVQASMLWLCEDACHLSQM